MSINKNIFYTLITQIPTIVLGVFSGVFITRILGPNGKGVYAVFQANIEFLSFFLGLNVASGLIYFTASKKIAPEKLVGLSIYFFVLTCVLVSVFFEILVQAKLEHFIMPKEYDSGFYIFYLTAAFCIGILSSLLSGIIQGHKDFKTVNHLVLINSIINAICFPALYLLVKLRGLIIGVHEILIVTLILAIINTIIVFVFYKVKINVKPDFKIDIEKEVKPFFKYLSVLYIGTIINFFNYRLDIWVLMNYSKDMKPVGYYSLAVSVAQLLWMVSNPFMKVVLPYLSETDTEGRIKKTIVYSRVNVAILFAGVLFLSSIGYYLLPIIYGKDFIDSVYLFEILLVGLFFSSAAKPFGTFFTAEDKYIVNVYSSILGVLATVVFCFWLIPIYGVIGACIATNVSYFVMFVFTYAMFRKFSGAERKNWFLIKKEDIVELGLGDRFRIKTK